MGIRPRNDVGGSDRRWRNIPRRTVQESQVTHFTRDGLSKCDIGELPVISPHTVAYHLRNVFSKPDITSRNELGRVLPNSADVGRVA